MSSAQDPALPPHPAMTHQRREQIAALVASQGGMRVGELSKRFGVSEVTIRHDLAELERGGRLTRDRGGAFPKSPHRDVTTLAGLDQRATLHLEQKRAIAAAAAAHVRPGDTILLDAGTTAVEMVPHLPAPETLTIVTNALNVALRVAATPARLILTGGEFHRESRSHVGPLAELALAGLCVTRLFLGAQAVDLDHGLTDSTSEIAAVKRAMILSAREIILLADASKWDSTALHKVAPLTTLTRIITDPALPPETRATLKSRAIPLELAPAR